MFSSTGELMVLDKQKKEQIMDQVVSSFAKKCYRTLMTTYVDVPLKEFERLLHIHNNFENDEVR